MQRILNFLSQLVAVAVILLGGLYVFKSTMETHPSIKEVINSQFFSAVITLLVGLTAYALYLKQQKDRKRDVAKLILQEIRYAEQKIRGAADRIPPYTYHFSDKLLPTNSWHRNIHLFTSDFEESDAIDTISQFYSRAAFLDYLIENIAHQKFFSTNQPSTTPVMLQPAGSPQPMAPIPGQPAQMHVSFAVSPSPQPTPQDALREVSQQVEYIYYSTAVEQLRKIALEK